MLPTSPTLVTQSLIDMADVEFGEGDCDENEARILSVSITSKDKTVAGYLIFNIKKTFNLL